LTTVYFFLSKNTAPTEAGNVGEIRRMDRKITDGLIALLILTTVVMLSCCVDKQIQLPTSSMSGIEITVDYPGSWAGELYDLKYLQQVEGTGERSFHQSELPYGVIVANFWKKDNSGRTLTVEIRHNGKLVKLDSTNQPYGFVRVEYQI